MTKPLSQIVALCQTLATEGKKPSVGLVRSRAVGKLSVPDAIKGIQSWQAQPDQLVESNKEENTTSAEPATLEDRVAKLEKQLLHLTQQLENLLAKV
ncbi:hypothetical protein Patl_3191 [Paraglaciecola sp. T6c]|uniref:hypothetical protein n=1 Tax=Pseudoalteromonas atlantica (strain T6c / ATCC BAA-1087) TaxID=3042615 RepID=UPI00005C5C90|nr:hypothetical protein [Paraglaciecola sp. T6c]ABG41697.1 hypothetical protein Patl_3191 [Paraglaciecola sp. T6c]